MPEKSSLSGRLLGGDDPVDVMVSLHDGRRYDLRVTAEEAEALVADGVRRTSRSARLREWGREHSGAMVKGLAGVLVALGAAWYGNQLADRYADRQEERQLEASFVTHMNRRLSALVTDAQEVAQMRPGPRQNKRAAKLGHRASQVDPDAEAVIAIYYGNDDRVLGWWSSFRFALHSYAELVCCRDAADQQEALADIRDYFRYYGSREVRKSCSWSSET